MRFLVGLVLAGPAPSGASALSIALNPGEIGSEASVSSVFDQAEREELGSAALSAIVDMAAVPVHDTVSFRDATLEYLLRDDLFRFEWDISQSGIDDGSSATSGARVTFSVDQPAHYSMRGRMTSIGLSGASGEFFGTLFDGALGVPAFRSSESNDPGGPLDIDLLDAASEFKEISGSSTGWLRPGVEYAVGFHAEIDTGFAPGPSRASGFFEIAFVPEAPLPALFAWLCAMMAVGVWRARRAGIGIAEPSP